MRLATTLAGVFAMLGASACSSSGDDSSGGDGNGMNGTGGTIFSVGGNGGDGMGNPPQGGPIDEGSAQALRDAACAGESAATEPHPSVIQLVVDVSGSMGRNAPGSNDSKWEVTRDALEEALGALPDTTAVGVLYYPNRNTSASQPQGNETDPPRSVDSCVDQGGQIPIAALGGGHRQAVIDSLDSINGPQGGTPTHDAYRLALGPIEQTTFPGNRFLVLITDGQPTFLDGCRGTGNVSDAVDPRPIVDEATAAASRGIATFVIGSPGSEEVGVPVFSDARTWLSRTASLGGTASPGCNDDGPNFCHFDMTQSSNFSQALRDALATIVGQVLSCTYTLPLPPSGATLDRDAVNVILASSEGEELIPKAADPNNCTEGWRYSADGQFVELCEGTCNRARASANPQLDVLFGCTSRTGPLL